MLNDTAMPTATPAPAPAPLPRTASPFPKRQARPALHACDMCGDLQGFLVPGFDHSYECAKCAAERMRNDLAREQLVEALSPVLGMWVAYWRRAGMSMLELDEIVELCSGADMAQPYEAHHRQAHLRRLGLVYREAGQDPEPDPVRMVVNPAELPLIARQIEGQGPVGRPAFFTAGNEQQVHVMPGMDAVILLLEGGVRAVIYPSSQVSEGFRVPAHLWPMVAAELRYLPEERVESRAPRASDVTPKSSAA